MSRRGDRPGSEPRTCPPERVRPPGRGAWILALVVLALMIGAAWAVGRRPDGRPEARATLSLLETLGGGDTAGYARAMEPRPFEFPADHGPHPDFRSEWWYLTGNLRAADGRRFGVQLTIFRSALAPESPGGRADVSSWRTRQAWMAHLAVADVERGRFHAFERFARGAAGLAGASAEPFRVWLGDWSIAAAGEGTWPAVVEADDGGTGLRLELAPLKPIVLQGERGLSRKGPEPGNASHYYSFPRLQAHGTVRVGGAGVPVTGLVWLDREWSTSALSSGVVGWDWFALHLDDGRDVMVYRLRRADGGTDPWSAGTLIGREGETRRLGADAFTIEPTGTWNSPVDGARYPSGWRVRIPSAELDLVVQPALDDQELDLSFRYWEGAVDVRSRAEGGPAGAGYVELTGYAGSGPPGRGDDPRR